MSGYGARFVRRMSHRPRPLYAGRQSAAQAVPFVLQQDSQYDLVDFDRGIFAFPDRRLRAPDVPQALGHQGRSDGFGEQHVQYTSRFFCDNDADLATPECASLEVLIPPPYPLESRFLWTKGVSVVGAVFLFLPGMIRCRPSDLGDR
jgi:hypothetical protein